MIVNEVDIGCLAILEAKDHPPIRAHGDGLEAFELTLQRMQAESGQPQRLDRFRRLPQSLMAEALDHIYPIGMLDDVN
jgi:hypothetical protein